MAYMTRAKLTTMVCSCGNQFILNVKGKKYKITEYGEDRTKWLFPGELAPWLEGYMRARIDFERRGR